MDMPNIDTLTLVKDFDTSLLLILNSPKYSKSNTPYMDRQVDFMLSSVYNALLQRASEGDAAAHKAMKQHYDRYLRKPYLRLIPRLARCDYIAWNDYINELSIEFCKDFSADYEAAKRLVEMTFIIMNDIYFDGNMVPMIDPKIALRVWGSDIKLLAYFQQYVQAQHDESDQDDIAKSIIMSSNLYKLMLSFAMSGSDQIKRYMFDFVMMK